MARVRVPPGVRRCLAIPGTGHEHAPAGTGADRINPAVGTVEPLDEHTCVLHTGADTIETLSVYLGPLGVVRPVI
ncbi:hypothetical protein ACWEWG_35730 [Streptomyces sp. NPDC003758]